MEQRGIVYLVIFGAVIFFLLAVNGPSTGQAFTQPEYPSGRSLPGPESPGENPVQREVDCDTGKPGICGEGKKVCEFSSAEINVPLHCGPCREIYPPSAEICDGRDNNCNGETDEDLPIIPSGTITLNVFAQGQDAQGQEIYGAEFVLQHYAANINYLSERTALPSWMSMVNTRPFALEYSALTASDPRKGTQDITALTYAYHAMCMPSSAAFTIKKQQLSGKRGLIEGSIGFELR